MGFFGLLFWMVLIWLAVRAFRGLAGCRSDRSYDRGLTREQAADQQSYIDALESRVSELEERLDFTERLVAGRGQVAG